jgi:hypothetical protein
MTTGSAPVSTTPTRLQKNPNQRRSQRVMLSVRILVAGSHADGRRFSEEAVTSVVNAHGALILLAEKVTLGQLLTVRNVKSGAELQAEVVDVGAPQDGKFEVGMEFLEPSPRFWRIAFPPEDWTPRSPEAKRRTTAPTPMPTPMPKAGSPK